MEVFKRILKDSPDFSSLNEIMLQFSMLPYEQFRKELDEWFLVSLKEKGVDGGEPLLADLVGLVKLIEEREGSNGWG
jgi:hypothetical protein